jgi:hypothetical protein
LIDQRRIRGCARIVAFRQPRQRIGPAERRAFAIGVAGRLAPRGQQIDALLGLARARASTVCMLRQFAHALICDARILTSSISVGSRLPAAATDTVIQLFISAGAAANGLSFAVMVASPFGWIQTT